METKNKDLENDLLARLKQGNDLLNSIANIKVDGVAKLRNKSKQEVQFLSKIYKVGNYKKDHLTCSNLKHLEAVAKELVQNQHCSVGVMVNKILTDEFGMTKKLCVDLILHGGRVWVKVVARNPKALSLVSAGEGYFGQKSIVEQGEEFVLCAQQHPYHYEPPKVIFRFAQGIEDDLAAELEAVGVIVQDANVDLCIDNNLSSLPITGFATAQSATNKRINLCVSTMIAYVSALTNGGTNYDFENPVLKEHAEWERLRPVKPILDKLFEGKELFCCRTALENFREILMTLGGPGECLRAEAFLERVTVVEDTIFSNLKMGGRVKKRSLAIFGTGEALKAVTATANHAFVRSATNKGFNFVVFLHESRALTEGKQIDKDGVLSASRSEDGTAADLRVGTVALSNVAKYWVLTNLFPGPIPQTVYLNAPGHPMPRQDGKHDMVYVDAQRDPKDMVYVTGGAAADACKPGMVYLDPSAEAIRHSHGDEKGMIYMQPGEPSRPPHSEANKTGIVYLETASERVQQDGRGYMDPGTESRVRGKGENHALHSSSAMENMVMMSASSQQISGNGTGSDNLSGMMQTNQGQGEEVREREKSIKADPGSCVTERVSDNQVHCQVQCDMQQNGPPPQHAQQTAPPQYQMSSSSGNVQEMDIKSEHKDDKDRVVMTSFPMNDIKGQLMDIRTTDGNLVKVQTDQDVAKALLNADMVQGMYKVNVEDINQLLAYHEVFGKLSSETAHQQHQHQQHNGGKGPEDGTSGTEGPGSPSSVGPYTCELCGKIFPFRYQLIVHRRYHSERKPFTCQVCGKAFTCSSELARHGKCHIGGSMFTCTICFHVFANEPTLERHMKRHSQDKPYVCTTCDKTFGRKEHLDNHIRSHTGETPYSCQFCSKSFSRKEHMVNHERKHTGETPHRCDICKKSFTRKEHFMNHVMWHTGETPHVCQVCGKKYTRKEHLANHLRSHTNDTPFRCEVCGKPFTRKEHFTNHILWHTGETPHRCDFCSKTFTRKEHLLNHVRQHTNESPHRCGYCSKSFTRKEHLLNHIRQHTGETPFRCQFCPKAFARKDHLVNHVRQHTGENPFKCQYCSKEFARKDHLVTHTRQHTGETPFQCSYCPKAFARRDHLTTHTHQHTGGRQFKCELCPKAFYRRDHLTVHMRRHSGEQPFACNFCPKIFSRKDHLTEHTRYHTGESPHKCGLCTKSFTRKEHLTNHVRLHTGESPHRCHFCAKSFTRKEHLVNHERVHTGESPHRCEFCQKSFTRKEHLTNHLRQHAGEASHCCNVCSKPFSRKEHLINHMRCHTGERPFVCTECGKSFPLKGNLLFHQRSHSKGEQAERPFHCDLCPKDFTCKGHLVSHRRAHAGERPHSCPDCGKTFVEKGNLLRHIRKHQESEAVIGNESGPIVEPPQQPPPPILPPYGPTQLLHPPPNPVLASY